VKHSSTFSRSATSTLMVPAWQGDRYQPGVNHRHRADTRRGVELSGMIEVTELRKRYGQTQALDGMTFSVRPGQVTGFVGPNGAGKSTTMRVILGLDAADAGTALIGGRPYAQGRAVLVSSHLLSELQDTADHLVVAGRGRVIADTSMRDLIASASGNRVTVHTSARVEATAALASAGATVVATAPDVLTIQDLSSERTVASLTAAHVPFTEVSAHQATLEDAYLELTRGATEVRATAAS
jgi:ABC-type multidrug transport system ATPase subunit